MTAFYQLYPLWRALFMLGTHLDTCLLLYIGIRFVQQRRPVWMRILTVLLAVASFVTQRFMMGETLAEAKGYPRRGIPALWLILPFLLLALVMTLLLCSIRRWGRNHITSASVKESFDALPEGICYYWEGGLPKLVNSRMQELSPAGTSGTRRALPGRSAAGSCRRGS